MHYVPHATRKKLIAQYLIRAGAVASSISWDKQMGWKPKDLLSKSMMDFIHPEDVELTKNALGKLDKRDVIYFENRCRKKSGEYRWLSWSASKWLHGGIYGVARDITDYKDKATKKGK